MRVGYTFSQQFRVAFAGLTTKELAVIVDLLKIIENRSVIVASSRIVSALGLRRLVTITFDSI
jgi:hypothetical protein